MKNITNIEKTVIENITAKITTTALLLFLLLFTLTTNLKAQAVQDNSKSGFFAGFVYLQGFQVDSSKSISESTATTSYEVTGTSDTTYIIADAASVYDSPLGGATSSCPLSWDRSSFQSKLRNRNNKRWRPLFPLR